MSTMQDILLFDDYIYPFENGPTVEVDSCCDWSLYFELLTGRLYETGMCLGYEQHQFYNYNYDWSRLTKQERDCVMRWVCPD